MNCWNSRKTLGAGLLAMVAALAAPSVWSEPAAEEAGAEAAQEHGLQEVTVTAQRRSEQLSKVPIAITALTATDLESSGIRKTEDLTRAVPGLEQSSSGANVITFIRGVGTLSGGSSGNESDVATYVDGVYMKTVFGSVSEFGYVDRIEVLKGPQGTLYGRNAAGGLIHIYTPDPQSDPQVKMKVGYESYNTVFGSAYATGALAAKLDGNITINYFDQSDGFGRDLNTGQDANYNRYKNVRVKLLWRPTDSDRVTLASDYLRDTSDSSVHGAVVEGTRTNVGGVYPGSIYNATESARSFPHASLWGSSVKWEHTFGNGMLFRSLSAYRASTISLDAYDVDFSPAFSLQGTVNRRSRDFQEDALIQGDAGPLSYTAGVFFMYAQEPSSVYDFFLLPQTLNRDLLTFNADRTVSESGYGQVDYHLTDQDTLTAGLRYTTDAQYMSGFNTAATGVRTYADQHKRFYKPTWRLAYKHQFNDDLMAYATYNRGYKSGVFNGMDIARAAVQPETVDAYEGGFKGAFLDRHLRVSIAGYYNDYKNLQVNRYTVFGSVFSNAAAAETYGVELETTALIPVPVGDLQLGANLSLAHPRLTSYPGCASFSPNPAGGNLQTVTDCSGNVIPYSPQTTFTLSPTYTVPLPGIGGKVALNVNYYHSSRVYFEQDNVRSQRPYGTLDAQLSYELPNNHARVRVYGRNLTNSEVIQRVFSTAAVVVGYPRPPRIFGIELGYDL